MVRVSAVYRCRHCGAVYQAGEFDPANLSVCFGAVGLYGLERVMPDPVRTAMWDIHACDGCCPRFGVADLVGWEA